MNQAVEQYVEQHQQQFLGDLCKLLERPTVSTDSRFAQNLVECAQYLAQFGKDKLGFTTRVEPTAGHPSVIMHSPEIPGAPRLLIYGHYDVQPAEDVQLWKHPPFEPHIEGQVIYGRGTCDDKGQIWAWLCALQTYLAVQGPLKLNVTVLIEGEEEIGSRHFSALLERLHAELACDLVVVSDTGTAVKYIPTLHYSLRGLVVFEVRLRTALADLHSGVHGGVSPNAVREMCRLVSSLHDAQERVTVPGFYNKVRLMEDWERQALAEIPFDEAEYAQGFGTVMRGEAGFSTNERRWFRPTLECNGIFGGYTGEGSKTIVPALATAKFSARLVADQYPQEVMDCLRQYFESYQQPGVQIEFVPGDCSKPYILAREGAGERIFGAASRAVEAGFGRLPLLCRNGGAIGVVADFERVLHAPTLLLGLGSPDDAIHSPNEKFELRNFFSGIKMGCALFDELAR